MPVPRYTARMTESFRYAPGDTPLLVSLPHGSTHIPDDIAARMTEPALRTADTDWHVDRLYDFAGALGASVIAATHSRYVVDLNRDPSGEALYSGVDNTEICPLTTFAREPIYRSGEEPDESEVARRIARYWRPYHDRLQAALDTMRTRFGVAVLFDGHTIRSEVPRFFDGRIPDLNLGTDRGASADPALTRAAFELLGASPYSTVLDDRFTGGYITRHYGRPGRNIHAIQLELTWRCYMEEDATFAWREDRAGALVPLLRRLVETLRDWAKSRATAPSG